MRNGAADTVAPSPRTRGGEKEQTEFPAPLTYNINML
jgi:hypothetical protein